jgi:hypothetical protein
MWLTLPVGKKDFSEVAINNVDITDEKISCKHAKTIKTMYSRAPFFEEEIYELIETYHKNLAEHNIFIITSLVNKLEIHRPKIVLASSLQVQRKKGTEGIIEIIKALKGTEYISGTGAKTYLEEKLLEKESINLSFLDFKPWRYPQLHPGFVENMSILDAIFNMGWKETSLRLRETKTRKVSFTNE